MLEISIVDRWANVLYKTNMFNFISFNLYKK